MNLYRIECWPTGLFYVGASSFAAALASIPAAQTGSVHSIEHVGDLVLSTETVAPLVVKPTPAQIKASITPDALVSFEDGKSYKMLRRHLSKLIMTPDDYRAKWGLAASYPMTAPSYSAKRSALAKDAGLGRK